MKRHVFSKKHPKKGFSEFLIIVTINILITCNEQIKDIKCLFDYFCQMKNVSLLTHHVKRRYILF